MKNDLKAIGKKDKKRALHLRRKTRVRKIVSGTTDRPRLSVFKSANHIYIQAIDDTASKTIASASSLDGGIKSQCKGKKKVEVAKLVGAKLGEKLVAEKLDCGVFDRNGFRYTGRVAAVADGIREAGLTV